MTTPSSFLRPLAYWCLAGLLADLLTKLLANAWLEPDAWIALGTAGAGLLLAYNPAGAFSWLPSAPELHAWWRVGSGAACVLVLALVCQYTWRRGVAASPAGWGLLFAGGLGNLLEQAFTGRATDFLVLDGYAEVVRVFNVADVLLGLGALWVGVGLVRARGALPAVRTRAERSA